MKRIVILTALWLGAITAGFAQKIEVFSPTSVVDLIKNKIVSIENFTGSFVYVYNNQTFSGTIWYKSPNKFRMDYSGSYNRIICDGKSLWIIYSGENVAVKEILDPAKNDAMVGWNIKRLLLEYAPTFPKEGYKVQYGTEVAYKIIFQPRIATAGFKSIEMVVSLEGFIEKVKAINQLGKALEMTVSYKEVNKGVAEYLFKFETDENTIVYENMLAPAD